MVWICNPFNEHTHNYILYAPPHTPTFISHTLSLPALTHCQHKRPRISHPVSHSSLSAERCHQLAWWSIIAFPSPNATPWHLKTEHQPLQQASMFVKYLPWMMVHEEYMWVVEQRVLLPRCCKDPCQERLQLIQLEDQGRLDVNRPSIKWQKCDYSLENKDA